MGRRFLWLDGDWQEYQRRPGKPVAAVIMRDVAPYRSVITGEMIGGRRQHREHLREHNCIEVGNERVTHRPVESTSADIVADIKRAMGE